MWSALGRGGRAKVRWGWCGAPQLRGWPFRPRPRSLCLGFARGRVDEQRKLKAGRAPIRALTEVAVKAKRAYGKAANQAAQLGGNGPPAGVPAAGQLQGSARAQTP